jgi:hypothetical protein
MPNKNPLCDGDQCRCETGEVRALPVSPNGNAILCEDCFNYEMVWRRDANLTLEDSARFPIPKFKELELRYAGTSAPPPPAFAQPFPRGRWASSNHQS